MKYILIVIVGALLSGCGESLPEQDVKDVYVKPVYKEEKAVKQENTVQEMPSVQPEKPDEKAKEETTVAPEAKLVPSEAAAPAQPQSVVSDTVNSAVNYGTGYTHLSVKKKQEEKLKAIQGRQEQKLQEVLEE